MGMLRALWLYRDFIAGTVRRDFQSRYRSSMLGGAWSVLHPLALILVYTIVFSQVMRARLPGADSPYAYGIYLCASILTWNLFAEIVTRSQNVFIENANLLKKLNFPRACLPAMVALGALLNFAIVWGLFTLFLVVTGYFPGLVYVGIVPVLAVHIAFAVGLGVTLGVLNVFFRDVGQFFTIFLQFWFWLTPLVYVVDVLPERFRPFMNYNPLAVLANAYQRVLVAGQWPEWNGLWPVTAAALLLCLVGLRLFQRHAGDMVDEL